jgi:hypothetical protein
MYFSQCNLAQLCAIFYGICRQKSTNKLIAKLISELDNFYKRLSVNVSGTEEHMTRQRAFHNNAADLISSMVLTTDQETSNTPYCTVFPYKPLYVMQTMPHGFN